jgi:Metal-dependent hydrolase
MKLTPRYLGLLAFCAAALVSCQREVELDQVLTEEPLTRTTYSSNNSIVWETSDQLRVRQVCYISSDSNAHAQLRVSGAPELIQGKYSVQASFDAVTPVPYVGHDKYNFMYQAFYPANRAVKNGTNVRLTLPDVQQPRSNSFDPSADLVVSDQVYSKSQRTNGSKVNGLTFSRLSSIGILNIKGLESNAEIRSIEISAGNAPLAGTYIIDINNSRTLDNDNKKYKITLDMAGNQPSAPDDFSVYFTCLPATYKNVEVKITTGNQGTYVRTFNQLVFTPGQKTNVPTIQIKKKVLMTYNVGCFKKSGSYMYDEIAGLLLEKNAMYISLNEVDKQTERNKDDQLTKLVRLMKTKSGHSVTDSCYWYHFGPALYDFQGGQYGSGVISSEEVIKNGKGELKYYHYQLTDRLGEKDPNPAISSNGKKEETRSLCVLETADCVFASAHLGLSEALRKVQVRQINQWFNSRYGNTRKPVFICGDFNAEPDEARTLMVTPGNWVFVSDTTKKSFNTGGKNPAKCIDYIFCKNNAAAPTVNVIDAIVVRSAKDGNIKDFSDHYPVRVEVAW